MIVCIDKVTHISNIQPLNSILEKVLCGFFIRNCVYFPTEEMYLFLIVMDEFYVDTIL